MPALFVLFWNTGYIGAKLGLPHVEPFTFLAVRFAIVAAILIAAALVLRAPWPRTPIAWARIAISGLLVQATYLGGVFAGIHYGVSAGESALIVSAQPFLTAVAAGPLLGERITRRQWLGFALGVVGVALVVWNKIDFSADHLLGLLFTFIALFGITSGTLYQKRHGADMDLRSGSAIQFAASAVPLGLLALAFETMAITWHADLIFAMSWLVIVNSIITITLLFLLIRRGAASKVASLFYLVPPVVAIIAFALFGEILGPMALAGMVLTVIGVALVTRGG